MENPKIAVALNIEVSLRRYHELFHGIQEYARENTDWVLVLDHFPHKVLAGCKGKPYYSGVIGRIKEPAYEQAKRLSIPVVNTWSSNKIKNLTTVKPDYFAAGEIAAEHLLNKGLRNFVNIDFWANRPGKAFYNGFMSVAGNYNCPVKRYLISNNCADSPDLWHQFNTDFEEWAKSWKFPMGIFCSLSPIGPVITSRCMANNLRVPKDVSVVSAGNDLSYCVGFHPSISSVEINFFKVGYESAEILHRKIQGEKVDQKEIFIKPSACIARESTDSYAVTDQEVKYALRYISNNFQNNISVNNVVDETSIGRTTLEARFRNEIGHSVFDEINRLRVASAKRHLLETNLTVDEISQVVGFSSSHHLIRVFKKDTGLTPSQFRKVD